MAARLLPLLLVLATALNAGPALAGGESFVYLALEGEVDLAMAPLVERAVEESEALGADAIFIELNTLGGRVDAALRIRDALLETEIPTTVYVRRAISAGALIALACDTIDMAPGATIGAATPITVDPTGEASPVDEKFTSYLRKEFGSTAEAHERRKDLAEAMVDRDVAIEDVIAEGKLLTLSTEEAIELAIANRQSADVDAALESAGVTGMARIEITNNWGENIARILTMPALSGLLLTIGMIGIIAELKSPGFGIGGAIGLAALIIFFAGHSVVRLVGWEDLLLVLLGLVLIAVEVFVIPGFGVAGLLGLAALCGGLVMAMIGRDWELALVSGSLSSAVTVVSAVLVATVAGFALILRYFPQTRLAQRTIVLGTSLDAESGDSFREDLEPLVGLEGIARTPLRPSGTVTIDERPVDAVSEGGMIDAGTPVRVVGTRGGSIVVRAAGEEAS
jgi:membrane-bound serine protease (ClpP class)